MADVAGRDPVNVLGLPARANPQTAAAAIDVQTAAAEVQAGIEVDG